MYLDVLTCIEILRGWDYHKDVTTAIGKKKRIDQVDLSRVTWGNRIGRNKTPPGSSEKEEKTVGENFFPPVSPCFTQPSCVSYVRFPETSAPPNSANIR